MDNTIYAEDVNYWNTSRTGADDWIARARTLITQHGGRVTAEGFGSEPETGRAAYMLAFELGGERYRVMWPMLPTRGGGRELGARRQAATMLYHDVKQRLISSMVLGARAALFAYLVLPDGLTAGMLAQQDLMDRFPLLLAAGQPGPANPPTWEEDK